MSKEKKRHQPQNAASLDLRLANNLLNNANKFLEASRFNEAIANYQEALLVNPKFAEAHNNLGVALQQLGKLDEAIECHQRAISIKPDYADAHRNLGIAFKAQGKLEAATKSYQAALSVKQGDTDIDDNLFLLKRECCDWKDYQNTTKKIIDDVVQVKHGHDPAIFLAISDSARAQQLCASTFAINKYPVSKTPLWTGQIYQHPKIRIAYLSADFHNHATAYLMAELFEAHDKNRFEMTAISFGYDHKDEMRARLVRSFDRFLDVSEQNDYEIAKLLRDLEIEIAIDLKGYTRHSRPGILAYRPTPVQVNYLGYPGTMGVDYIDYILADHHLIPLVYQACYTEKVVYLPDSYQVNDSKRLISKHTPTRAELKLPAKGFVFCCFNNNYKTTPQIFDSWMRILSRAKDSVLWLLEDNPTAAQNLRTEAMQRGIKAERLVFAPRVKLDAHLARHKLADLFLDTLPCNAHTTASDALWAGLPVLTCTGESFASRVAGSLLNAIGLPELITHSLEEYETLAIKLATTPALLAEIRAKLAKNRTPYPLFDTDRFRRHIESAYITMWERYQRGDSPAGFAVQPILITETPLVNLSVSTLFQTAMQYHQSGDFAQAETFYRQIIQQEPNNADALHFLGVLAYQVGQNEMAVDLISKAVSACPTFSPMYCNLGLALQALGKLDAAAENHQKSLLLQPDYTEAYYNLGNVFQAQGKFDSAIENYQHAISLNPDFALAHNNLGNAFKQQNNLDAAIRSYRAALAIQPDYAGAYNNLGVVLHEQGNFDSALASYRNALLYDSNDHKVYGHIGAVFEAQAKHDAALEYYQKALELKPDYADAHCALGLLQLYLGQFSEGWRHCEARSEPSLTNRNTIPPDLPIPQWQGEPIEGKSLLVWYEQGLGDEIQFCRYASVLKSLGARHITWVCRKPLKPVFKTLEAVDIVATEGENIAIASHDYWTFVLSLPFRCKTTLDNVPATIPYLYANPDQVKMIAANLNSISEFKAGVCWKGNPAYKNDRNRSPGITPFEVLFETPGVKFFTLQPGTREEFLAAAGNSAVDRGHEIDPSSFEEAAALIMNLDLVITCDTSICHLAGALGKPVWVVLPFAADWRWLVDREDSPWYPNTRIFRQSEAGNWLEVFQRVENRLKKIIAGTEPIIWPV